MHSYGIWGFNVHSHTIWSVWYYRKLNREKHGKRFNSLDSRFPQAPAWLVFWPLAWGESGEGGGPRPSPVGRINDAPRMGRRPDRDEGWL